MSMLPLEDNLFEKKVDTIQTSITDEELDEEWPQTSLPSPTHAPNGSNTKPGDIFNVDQKNREMALAAMQRIFLVADNTRNVIFQKLSKMQAEYDTIARRREEVEFLEKKIKKTLQDELDDVSSKDDADKNLYELERAKLQLEEEVRNLKARVGGLEDVLAVAEDSRLRMDITMQVMRMEHERELLTKSDEDDESRRSLSNGIRDLEAEIENERRTKASAVAEKNKLKNQIIEVEHQMEAENRSLLESERKSRTMEEENHRLRSRITELEATQTRSQAQIAALLEAENHLLQEANDNLLSRKRQLEAYIEELEELRSKGGNFSSDERRLLESTQSEEELEEEQGNAELAQDKCRKTEQVESLTKELSMERGICQRLDAEKQALERTNRELRSRIIELESTQTRSQTQISALGKQPRGPDGRFMKK